MQFRKRNLSLLMTVTNSQWFFLVHNIAFEGGFIQSAGLKYRYALYFVPCDLGTATTGGEARFSCSL